MANETVVFLCRNDCAQLWQRAKRSTAVVFMLQTQPNAETCAESSSNGNGRPTQCESSKGVFHVDFLSQTQPNAANRQSTHENFMQQSLMVSRFALHTSAQRQKVSSSIQNADWRGSRWGIVHGRQVWFEDDQADMRVSSRHHSQHGMIHPLISLCVGLIDERRPLPTHALKSHSACASRHSLSFGRGTPQRRVGQQ
jgi:hypothetical protein